MIINKETTKIDESNWLDFLRSTLNIFDKALVYLLALNMRKRRIIRKERSTLKSTGIKNGI